MDKQTTYYYLVPDPKAMKSLKKNHFGDLYHLGKLSDFDKKDNVYKYTTQGWLQHERNK